MPNIINFKPELAGIGRALEDGLRDFKSRADTRAASLESRLAAVEGRVAANETRTTMAALDRSEVEALERRLAALEALFAGNPALPSDPARARGH
jgi:uncharacterized protein involved in exopolysaccharide biosynthesis